VTSGERRRTYYSGARSTAKCGFDNVAMTSQESGPRQGRDRASSILSIRPHPVRTASAIIWTCCKHQTMHKACMRIAAPDYHDNLLHRSSNSLIFKGRAPWCPPHLIVQFTMLNSRNPPVPSPRSPFPGSGLSGIEAQTASETQAGNISAQFFLSQDHLTDDHSST
jgi:hypothetical protein